MDSGNSLDNFLSRASTPLKKTIPCLQFCMPNGSLNGFNSFSYFPKVTGNASPNNSICWGLGWGEESWIIWASVSSVFLGMCGSVRLQRVFLFSWKETWRCKLFMQSILALLTSSIEINGPSLSITWTNFTLQIPNISQHDFCNEIMMRMKALL